MDAAPPERFEPAFDRLHEVVAARVGHCQFGDDDYHVGLRVLLQSIDYDPILTEQGRAVVWRHLIDTLTSRARACRSMAEHPDYERQVISNPVVITGIPRTGTTALHKLMAVDPQFQGLEKWLLSAPMPRPPRETWSNHPLFMQEIERLKAHFAASPQLRAAHNLVAEDVEECLWVQRQSFVSNFWTCAWSSASYDAWWQSQSELRSYEYLCRNLKLIGSNDPGRRWLLKNPSHMLNLDLLFEVMPDAIVIQTHRDPARAVPSLCALLMSRHSLMEVGRAEQRARLMMGREIGKWARGVRKAERTRQAHAHRIMDVLHVEFHANPMATIARLQ
jgi:Sulfotransferase family